MQYFSLLFLIYFLGGVWLLINSSMVGNLLIISNKLLHNPMVFHGIEWSMVSISEEGKNYVKLANKKTFWFLVF